MYSVELSQEARRFYERCEKPASRKLARCFEALETDPHAGNNVKPLKGRFAGTFRYRVGNLRVIYSINETKVTVYVITIAKRSDIYE